MTENVVKFAKSTSALHFARVKEAPKGRNVWDANVPAGTTPEQVLVPTYWKHLTEKIRARDIIEVLCEDGSWECEYRVMFVNKEEAFLSPRRDVKYHEQVTVEDDSHDVRWHSPATKWGIFPKGSKEPIKTGFATKEAAYRHLSQNQVA